MSTEEDGYPVHLDRADHVRGSEVHHHTGIQHSFWQADFVVHFHGWQNNVEAVLGRYQLIEQLVASRRNAVLVVPQGPCNAPDSFGGKLEDPDGFARFMNEVAERLRFKSTLKLRPFILGSIVLSGHSGGYQVISSILRLAFHSWPSTRKLSAPIFGLTTGPSQPLQLFSRATCRTAN